MICYRPYPSLSGEASWMCCWSRQGESRQRLEAITGRPVDTFAYPCGQGEHYTPDTVALVQEARFRCACANV